MLKIFTKVGFVILIALILSIGLEVFYIKAYGLNYPWPKNIFSLPAISDKYELVALGNSHSQEGLTFGGYKVKSLSLASVAQSYAFDFAMLKMHSAQIKKNAIIFIIADPISFSQTIDTSDHAYNLYYDGRLSPFLIPHFRFSDYLQIELIPFVRSGFVWRQQYATDAQTAGLSSFVADFQKNQPGTAPTSAPQPVATQTQTQTQTAKVIEPASIYNVAQVEKDLNAPPATTDARFDESVSFTVNKWYKSGGFSEDPFNQNEKDLKDIVTYSKAQGWRSVLITLPISQALLNGLGPNFLNNWVYTPLKNANVGNVPYINLMKDPRLIDNLYVYTNSDHLNTDGASMVSYVILQQLIKMGYLPKSADGYQY